MARLSNIPTNTLHRDLPEKDKTRLALEWLRENPSETPTTAARIYHLEKPNSLFRAWKRENTRGGPIQHRSQNKILWPEQHKALIRYMADQAMNGGKGATKQMLYNCAMWQRTQDRKTIPL
jgi:hypothetical protein